MNRNAIVTFRLDHLLYRCSHMTTLCADVIHLSSESRGGRVLADAVGSMMVKKKSRLTHSIGYNRKRLEWTACGAYGGDGIYRICCLDSKAYKVSDSKPAGGGGSEKVPITEREDFVTSLFLLHFLKIVFTHFNINFRILIWLIGSFSTAFQFFTQYLKLQTLFWSQEALVPLGANNGFVIKDLLINP